MSDWNTAPVLAGRHARLEPLQAAQDGVLRNHLRHADGSIRDTVTFSIIDAEWPAVKRHLQARLDAHVLAGDVHDEQAHG